MSFGLIIAVTIIYFTVGIFQVSKGSPGFGLMWMSYGMANVGLLWAGGAK